MKKAVIYIHGKGGNAQEAEHYKPLFPDSDLLGFAYKAETPWEAKTEFTQYFETVCQEYPSVCVIANSIGAYFTMHAEADGKIEKAYFISPIVDMERLISSMMQWASVSEEELRLQGTIQTSFGEVLSWEYLCYVRNHPVKWAVPTRILYGENDHLTAYSVISAFAEKIGASLQTMPGGEHWFHTEEQMAYLDAWIMGGEYGENLA